MLLIADTNEGCMKVASGIVAVADNTVISDKKLDTKYSVESDLKRKGFLMWNT